MKRNCVALCASLLILVSSHFAFAQSPACSLTNHCDFCVASQGISPIEMGRSGLRFDLRYLSLTTPYSNGVRQPRTGESESHLTSQVTLMYYVNPWLSASVILPFVYRTASMPEMGGAPPSAQLTNDGLGDVVALARFKLLSNTTGGTTKVIALTAGMKLPTGSIDKQEASGELADAHMQLGTGTWDPAAGASLLLGHSEWAIAGNALATFPSAQNASGHRFGNNLNYDATLRYRMLDIDEQDFTLFVTGGIAGEWRGKETSDNVTDPNSGGNVTYATPGLQCFLSDFTSIEASYQFPIVHDLNGDQLGESYRITAGLQYLF